MLSLKDMLKRDHGLEVRVSGGSGTREAPFVLEACDAEEAALSQLRLLRGIGLGSGPWFWRMIDWQASPTDRSLQAVAIQTVHFSRTEIVRTDRTFYFDARAVTGDPHVLHPLSVWKGPAGAPVLPYELGWLHFDGALDNSLQAHRFDHSIAYSGPGAKATVYVYDRPATASTREDELRLSAAAVMKPGVTDPWPEGPIGPFLAKFLLSGDDMTIIAIAECGPYFVKLRLTHFDEGPIRSMMADSVGALADAVTAAVGERN